MRSVAPLASPVTSPHRARLCLAFVNTDASAHAPGSDLLRDVDALVTWREASAAVDEERALGVLD